MGVRRSEDNFVELVFMSSGDPAQAIKLIWQVVHPLGHLSYLIVLILSTFLFSHYNAV